MWKVLNIVKENNDSDTQKKIVRSLFVGEQLSKICYQQQKYARYGTACPFDALHNQPGLTFFSFREMYEKGNGKTNEDDSRDNGG